MPLEKQIQPVDKSAPRGEAWRAAEVAGIDMSLLEHKMSLTMWERMVEHQRAFELVQILQNAKIKSSCKT